MLPFLQFLEKIMGVDKASYTVTSSHMTLALMVPAGVDTLTPLLPLWWRTSLWQSITGSQLLLWFRTTKHLLSYFLCEQCLKRLSLVLNYLSGLLILMASYNQSLTNISKFHIYSLGAKLILNSNAYEIILR